MKTYHRETTSSLFHELKSSPERLDFRHCRLLHQRDSFFSSGQITSIRMWHRKVLNALEYRRKKYVNLGTDIHNSIQRRPYDPDGTAELLTVEDYTNYGWLHRMSPCDSLVLCTLHTLF